MYLNETGKIADDCWSGIPAHFEKVELGEFQIMPNHVHGIIIINDPVETRHALSLTHHHHFFSCFHSIGNEIQIIYTIDNGG